MQRAPGFTPADTLVAVTTLSFDIAGLELFLPLISGGTVVIATREQSSDGRRLQQLLRESRATVMQATPATWQLLIESGWQGDAALTVLCGGETCADMARFGRAKRDFLQEFLTLAHGIPSHDTFSRVFRLLDPVQFHACFLSFMRTFAEGCRGVVALDGKTLKRSFDRASGQSPLHLVSAWAVEQRLVLGQVAVDEKSNEITAVPQLLRMLSLAGTVVTADAMACQREIAQQAQRGRDVARRAPLETPG